MTEFGEEIDAPATEGVRFYDSDQVTWGAFLGGPLAGCWFMSRNWKLLGDEGRAARMLLNGFVATFAIGIVTPFLPEHIPHMSIPLGYSAVIRAVAQTYQKPKLDELKGSGGQAYSSWKVAGISLLWTAVTFVLIVAELMAVSHAFPGFLPIPKK